MDCKHCDDLAQAIARVIQSAISTGNLDKVIALGNAHTESFNRILKENLDHKPEAYVSFLLLALDIANVFVTSVSQAEQDVVLKKAKDLLNSGDNDEKIS